MNRSLPSPSWAGVVAFLGAVALVVWVMWTGVVP